MVVFVDVVAVAVDDVDVVGGGGSVHVDVNVLIILYHRFCKTAIMILKKIGKN